MAANIQKIPLSFFQSHARLNWGRRLWRLARLWARSGSAQFVAVFLAFVFLGAFVEFFLEGGREGSRFSDFFQAFWFTVVTITTVGYGDMAPVTPLAQGWAMVEMLVGIGLVGIITGNVASLLVERNRKVALGLVSLSHLSGHTVICGWKKGMQAIVVGILEANPNLSSADLVLVNGQNPGEVGELKRSWDLRHLHFVFGSHTDPNALQMANIGKAERVIVLAEDGGDTPSDAVDSRTVLAATTVETLSRSVYTCTELVQPHFARYLGHARVEEVVLGEQNARSLLVAASLGNGIANLVTSFFPENGQHLRVLPIPERMVGRSYRELGAELRGQGMLPVGLLENTGNLYARKRERVAAALRVTDYGAAVRELAEVRRLRSNLPLLAPPPEMEVGPSTRALAIVPPARYQSAEERGFRRSQAPRAKGRGGEHLAICGWKRNMAGLLKSIVAAHEHAGRPLGRVSVVSSLPPGEAEDIRNTPQLSMVELVLGETTDPAMLRQGGIPQADRVLVLDVAGSARSGQEADARNVMVAIAVNDINPRAYKCVELFNPKFGQHLQMAEVEETVFTQRYRELMLVQAALGTGLSHAIGRLLQAPRPALQVRDFPPAPVGTSFGGYAELVAAEGQTLVGVIDHTGNLHSRKGEVLFDARVQPRLTNAIDHLLRLKNVVSNQPLLNPGEEFVPGSHTRAVVIAPPTEKEALG